MSVKMGREKRGPLALELWAKQLIDSYPGVTVRNMTTSWRNGLAFCALIHRFRPDLIDYDKLDPSDIIGNCSLAFDTAESKLGIPALLDPEDMLTYEVPDRLSVLTYVAQFYSTFKNAEAKSRVPPRKDENVEDNDNLKNRSGDKLQSVTPEKMVAKRKMEANEDEIMDKVKRNMPNRSIMLSSSNVCSECTNPVFISERILFMKKLYHRTCFRCSSCESPLNPHTADVSPDGLLFCLEKKCHLELLKRIQMKQKGSETHVEDPDMQIKKHCEDNNSAVNLNELSSQAFNSNSESILSIHEDKVVEPSEDNESSESNKPHSHIYGEGRVSAMKALFNGVHGDGQNHGDIQKSHEKKIQSSTATDKLDKQTSKLMNFAGALLHIGEKDDNQTEQECLPEEPLELPICDKNNQNHSIDDIQKDDYSTSGVPETVEVLEVNSNAVVDIRSTAEEVSIRNKAVLNVADQFKHLSEESTISTEDLGAPMEETENRQDLEKLDTGEQEIQYQCPEESEELSKNCTSESPEPIQTKEIEIPLCKGKNDIDESNQNKESLSNPFDDEEIENSINTEASPDLPTTPSPLPRIKPLGIPSSPVVSVPPSPVPSPMPRTRSSKNKPSTTTKEETGSNIAATELWKKEDYYPSDLNPFESEEDVVSRNNKPSVKIVKPEPKNPFEDDDDEEVPHPPPSPKPRSSTPISKSNEINNNGLLNEKDRSPAKISNHLGANFNVPPPRPPPPQPSPRKVVPSATPYNPFEDDDDDIGEYDDEKPTGSFARSTDDTSSISSKMSNLSSISNVPTPRSLNASDTEGYGSTKLRSRKSRRAPLPPNMIQQQQGDTNSQSVASNSGGSGGLHPPIISIPTSPLKKVIPVSPKLMRGLKSPSTPQHYKKKRRAPPPRRRVEPLPEALIKTEFADLEVKQKELERQGITLESNIRQMMQEDELEADADSNHNEQLDEMMIQLWSIVNEKNDILRRQTELEYLRRGHRLEEMQSELEFKLRILMDTPPDQKQPDHADLEQLLLQQLLKLVDERNEVVEWLDYHRQLDREEDMMLSKSISQFSTSKAVEPIPEVTAGSKNKKKSEKKAEAKAKSKEDSSKDKKKESKLKLGIFGKKKNKKPKDVEEQNGPAEH